MRHVCLWLHDDICYSCKKYHISVDVHHIDQDSKNHDLKNLMPLCKPCHKLIHRVPIQPQISRKSIVILLLKKIANFE